MNIGVYGDSFAEAHTAGNIWWKFLQNRHGHQVTCHGSSGSSLCWSAESILQQHHEYDLVIWCMTGPGRYTVTLEDGGHLHLNPNQQPESYTDLERRTISQAYRDFVRYVMDWKYVTLESRAVIGHVQQVCKNVMMVPCFAAPLWDDSRSTPGFNLFEVSRRELQYYFPSTPTRTVLENHDDLRPAHLTDENNRMLACLINEHLGPGLFDPGYGEFDTAPKQPFDQCFRKKK